jgi:hypothetical protein
VAEAGLILGEGFGRILPIHGGIVARDFVLYGWLSVDPVERGRAGP